MTSQFQILCKVLQTQNYKIISENHLTSQYFFNYPQQFNYIQNHYRAFNKVPDMLTFLQQFPDFTPVDVQESADYLIEQLVKDYKASIMATGFNKIKKLLEAGKIEEAQQALVQSAEDVKAETGVSECVNLTKDRGRFERYLDRVNNPNNYYIQTGFKELDSIIGGIDVENENMVIAARTGIGKCLEKGTKIMMADGTLKKVEDVVVGDQVQSYNRINTVLDLHNGVSNGYKIIPNIGKPFVVSANHILTLYKYDTIVKNHKQLHAGTGHLEDIMVEDFLALSKRKQHLYKLFKPAINYSTKNQPIDPYILGVWLGDDTSKYDQICTADIEVVKAIYDYAAKANMQVHDLVSQQSGKAHLYSLCSTSTGKGLQTLLKENNLVNNKHIPLNYLTGDFSQRLSLLAGLLDSDGCYRRKSNVFDFTNNNFILIDQVAQLCRGLGFKVSENKAKKVKGTLYRRLIISGNLQVIPTKVTRKQACSKNIRHVSTNTGFKIEPVERVEYYGFMCDGDSRYLLEDNTLTHNTWTLLKMVAAAVQQGIDVLLYSGEMTADKVGYRLDTLLGHIDNKTITRGLRDTDVEIQYKNYLKSMEEGNYGNCYVITPNDIKGPATVDAIQAEAIKLGVKMVFIDQYSLLDDSHGAKIMHEKVANISKDIKNMQVKLRIPIISVSQMNRTKNEDGTQDTTQIGLSDRIGQDATTILMLSRDGEDGDIFKINIVKARDGGDGKKLSYKANFNTGYFCYLDETGDSSADSESYNSAQNAEYGEFNF